MSTTGAATGHTLKDAITRVTSRRSHTEKQPESEDFVPSGSATAKFRDTVRKVMQLKKTSAVLGGFKAPGAEPGIDPRRPSSFAAWGHIRERCEIEVVDYSSTNVTITQHDNQSFVDYLQESRTLPQSWAKVRWINVGGISWDVLSALTIKYDLHPISLENILQARRTSRSKVDYYSKHLFLHILCHSLQEDQASPLERALSTTNPLNPVKTDIEAGPRRPRGKETKTPDQNRNDTIKQRRIKAADKAVGLLKGNVSRVHVKISSLYLFLTRDGTLITIHSTDRGFGNPILARLKQRGTLLRSTSDPSLLLQALLDLVVDRAMDIVDQYHEEILKIERRVLISPRMSSVRALHVLSEDLTFHRRTLEPLKTLIFGLRRYDTDRAVAMAESMGSAATPEDALGFLSHKAKIYLADVHDHVEFILASFERFESISENLINFTFNTLSYEMNEAMRRLTIATIIFLPPTFVTGYFGQNWTYMLVKERGDEVFWIIALPFTALVILVFLYKDIIRNTWIDQIYVLVYRGPSSDFASRAPWIYDVPFLNIIIRPG